MGIFSLLIGASGIIFTIAGFILYKFPPKKINHLYGYRTRTSMQSQERWDFAQKYSAKKMMQGGIILILSAWAGFHFQLDESKHALIGLLIVIFITAFILFITEKKLRKINP